MHQKTSLFILLLITFFFTACNFGEKKPLKLKKVFLEGNASEENYAIAQKYFREGEYQKALEFHLKQLEEDLKYYKDESLEIASDYNNIGLDYDELKNYEKALAYYLKTIKIDEVVLENNSTERSTTFYNIAVAYDVLEQYPNAIKYYTKALVIDEVLQGTYHPDVLAEYEGLAIAYKKILKPSFSLKYWRKSLKFKEHEYAKYSLDTNETRAKVEELEEQLEKKDLLKKTI